MRGKEKQIWRRGGKQIKQESRGKENISGETNKEQMK